VLRELSRGQLSIQVLDEANRKIFGLLADDTGDLYENIENLRESLQSLVDLCLTASSFSNEPRDAAVSVANSFGADSNDR
jgi:hypothetical protein